MIRKLASTCFYVGCVPGAPGTYASLVAVGLCLLLMHLLGSAVAALIALALAAVFFFFGAWLGRWAESYFGTGDPSAFVLDEIVGYFVAAAPVLLVFPNAKVLPVLGLPFLFFRVFDVLKPFPVNVAETAPDGWGIMLDDVVAGCYAAVTSITGIVLFADTLVRSGG